MRLNINGGPIAGDTVGPINYKYHFQINLIRFKKMNFKHNSTLQNQLLR